MDPLARAAVRAALPARARSRRRAARPWRRAARRAGGVRRCAAVVGLSVRGQIGPAFLLSGRDAWQPTESSRHFTVKPAARPTGHQRVGDQAGVLTGLAGGPSSSVPARAVAESQRACRRRFARAGACGCLRLQCRRPRDGAQAARFARARPDGRPAGAPRPRRGAGSRLVSHTTRPERAKEDIMNRWTGTGHLTKDPKFLETDERDRDLHAADRRQARRQAGPRRLLRRQVLRRPGARLRALPQGRARGRDRRPPAVRRVPDPGRRLRLARLRRRRARRVPRQPQALQRSGQRRGLPRTARQRRRGARGPPGRLTTIAGPRRSTGRGPDDFHPKRCHSNANKP